VEFAPIAIVGQGCVLPQAHSPEQLWRLVLEGRDVLTPAQPDDWNHETLAALTYPDTPPLERLLSTRGGFVHGFAARFDPTGYRIAAESLLALDPLFQWLLYAGQEALRSAGHDMKTASARVGAIVGNLSYPTRALVEFAERVWWARDPGEPPRVDPRNRFSSGLPAHILAEALGLGAGAFALDSACASSLYAIKLACDWLHDGRADLMLAGGVNAADRFIIHGGFSVLQAISPSGRSRPFHRHADGLVPAEGAAIVALKRLDDAEAAGDRIAGVIRGVGLSNDGRGHGLLVPSATAQCRAMCDAYAMAGLRPADVSLIECHATGTLVGDATEIRSMAEVFRGVDDLPIGSLKSNVGHLITAAGAAGLLKVLAAMDAGVRPPTLHAADPIEALAGSPFRLPDRAEPWTSDAPRRAGLSAFGFGGNNAHLVVEQWTGASRRHRALTPPPIEEAVAITAIGIRVGDCRGREAFTRALLAGSSLLAPRKASRAAARADAIDLDLPALRFPPNDLRDALPQQLLILETAQQIAHEIGALPPDRTGVFVGMQCDAEGARIAARCHVPHRTAQWRGVELPGEDARRGEAYANVSRALTPAGVIGAMPNIVANRLQSWFDLKGLGTAISAEELSGLRALELGARAVRRGELDAAVVGAVDLSCEPVHEAAAAAMLPEARQCPADAAVLLVLKRVSDARRDGDTIYATLPPQSSSVDDGATFDADEDAAGLSSIVGHAHAASGLVHATAAAIACYHRALPAAGRPAAPWLPGEEPRTASVSVGAIGGARMSIALQAESGVQPVPPIPVPRFRVYSADSRDGLLRALREDAGHAAGRIRLAVVGRDAATFDAQRERAIAAVRVHRLEPCRLRELADGIYLGEEAHQGDVAFVFTGPAGAYAEMGRDLLVAMPELADGAAARCGPIRRSPAWMAARRAGAAETPLDMLWSASLLSQIHAELTRGVLAIEPQAAIGFSAGESNALFALGAWTDMDRMHQEFEARGVFSRELGGACEALRRSRPGNDGMTWSSWRVLAPVDEVRRALSREPTVHLTIISTPTDVVIAGAADGCQRVVEAVGTTRAQALDYNVVMHCPEAAVYADEWRALHHRPTRSPEGIRFYTHATCSHYQPTADRVADMLTQQAMGPVDFPRLIESAWNDGVRVFIEHGPQAGCTRGIDQILGDRPHVAVALDRYGTSPLRQVLDTVARLAAAGVPAQYDALIARLESPERHRPTSAGAGLVRFAAHWAPVRVPAPVEMVDRSAAHEAGIAPTPQVMEPAPWLPPVSDEWTGDRVDGAGRDILPLAARQAQPSQSPQPPQPQQGPFARMAAHRARVSALHDEFLRQQTEVQQQFLRLMQHARERLVHAGSGPPAPGASVAERPAPPTVAQAQGADPPAIETRYSTGPPRGPRLSREQLFVHASGAISDVFGSSFASQDRFQVQVRLPEEPLLLVDRVTGLDAEPGSMQLGTIWTETDIDWDRWYLHHGRMPAGIMVEAGQADLLLISWLGVDALNQGERVYRLLGCEGTFHGELPKPGDTLCYDIHVDGYARQGPVLLFFFHYDCRIDGELRLTVRNGHAGFFTPAELEASQGVLWNPGDLEIPPDARFDTPAVKTTRTRFSREQVRAFSEGRVSACFGPGFERAETHTRSPHFPSGRMGLLGEVVELAPAGGPAGRGYLRCVTRISPDDWFFPGHFKNDPCMPGTLMFEACLHAMAFYLTSMGCTLARDGWRFEPVPDETYALKCRGQATPASKELVYEVFVIELVAEPFPTLYADILCTVDGRKAFHGQRIGLRLVPDWPLESTRGHVDAMSNYLEPRPVANVDGFSYGYASLLACAWGRPSSAFGEMYRLFDGPRRVARLPGPPYHVMSRVCRIDAPRGAMQQGSTIESEYDVPPDAWYFEQNGVPVMPCCVLVEAALQPCGWLASYIGCALTTDEDLYFRNLDGTATILMEVRPDTGTLRVRTTLISLSRAAGTILVAFDVEILAGDVQVARLATTFGFFTAAALANQSGIPALLAERASLEPPAGVLIDLTTRPSKYFTGTLRLPDPMLLMIYRVTAYGRSRPSTPRRGTSRHTSSRIPCSPARSVSRRCCSSCNCSYCTPGSETASPARGSSRSRSGTSSPGDIAVRSCPKTARSKWTSS
jgi:acyl transferase domain-containing protein/3-hydroxymyristoyl/3-hydroxydecanoyl-(acyl carrier protein) dehydratase